MIILSTSKPGLMWLPLPELSRHLEVSGDINRVLIPERNSRLAIRVATVRLLPVNEAWGDAVECKRRTPGTRLARGHLFFSPLPFGSLAGASSRFKQSQCSMERCR